MKISQKHTFKFQEGGAMPMEAPMDPAAQGGAPMEGDPSQGGADPIVQLYEIAVQALESQDCQAAMAVCDGLASLVQSAGGGGAPAEEGAPVFAKGGKIVKRIRK